MSTNLRDKSDQEWHTVDILQRLQCLIENPGHSVRYSSRAVKTWKDARKEIATLRNGDVALKEAFRTIDSLRLENSKLNAKIESTASSVQRILSHLDYLKMFK